MKLNLGCGYKKRQGYLNVDNQSGCQPDVILDLENEKWPWPDNSVEDVFMEHILEHLGETKAQYFHVIRELYRVCQDRAQIHIVVPHPNHENFLHDCTHVRPITPEGLAMFSQKRNLETIANGGAESSLGLYLGVNFELISVKYRLEDRYMRAIESKTISDEQMTDILKSQNNVAQEIAIELVAVK